MTPTANELVGRELVVDLLPVVPVMAAAYSLFKNEFVIRNLYRHLVAGHESSKREDHNIRVGIEGGIRHILHSVIHKEDFRSSALVRPVMKVLSKVERIPW